MGRGSQRGGTFAVDQWVGVVRGDHDARHAGRDERLDARWGAAVVTAGLERHVDCGARGLAAGGTQCGHLRVRLARALVPALADYAATLRDNTADARVRVGGFESAHGQSQRTLHGETIEIGEHVVC